MQASTIQAFGIGISMAAVAALAGCERTPTAVSKFDGLHLPGASHAATPASRTEFEGFIHFCETEGPADLNVTPGETLHFKGGSNVNQWVTGNPLLDGFEENVVDANINLKTGKGSARVQSILVPDAVDGTWVINATVKIEGGVPLLRGVGHGTGDLHGMTIKVAAEPPVAGVNVCNPEDLSGPIRGVIISPASRD